VRVIGLAGWSGAGKTTLLIKLIPEFRRRGLAVSTLKHAHHTFDIDQPGKDSFEHREAGAAEVLVASSRRWALVHDVRDEPEPALSALLRRLSPTDLVIVEGYKAHVHPKIEVYRAANSRPFLFAKAPNVRAIAADVPVPDAPVPVLHLDDVRAIADAMLAAASPITEALADLDAAGPARRLAPRGTAGRS
jgi:molybdopterin-guanine dinucleotide biosynthesis protein B